MLSRLIASAQAVLQVRAQALIADAIRRQGEDDKPKERKGKAKAKAREVA